MSKASSLLKCRTGSENLSIVRFCIDPSWCMSYWFLSIYTIQNPLSLCNVLMVVNLVVCQHVLLVLKILLYSESSHRHKWVHVLLVLVDLDHTDPCWLCHTPNNTGINVAGRLPNQRKPGQPPSQLHPDKHAGKDPPGTNQSSHIGHAHIRMLIVGLWISGCWGQQISVSFS